MIMVRNHSLVDFLQKVIQATIENIGKTKALCMEMKEISEIVMESSQQEFIL